MKLAEDKKKEIGKYKFFVMKLAELGIYEKYTGYYFLVYILDLLINKRIKVKSFYKDVYPLVAKEYNKTECSIERDIRNLIKKIWQGEINDRLSEVWGSKTRPTCCKLIYVLKNYMYSPLI